MQMQYFINALLNVVNARSILHLSHGFQFCPMLNRQPYKVRLPLTGWWRKLSIMTVGQSN